MFSMLWYPSSYISSLIGEFPQPSIRIRMPGSMCSERIGFRVVQFCSLRIVPSRASVSPRHVCRRSSGWRAAGRGEEGGGGTRSSLKPALDTLTCATEVCRRSNRGGKEGGGECIEGLSERNKLARQNRSGIWHLPSAFDAYTRGVAVRRVPIER